MRPRLAQLHQSGATDGQVVTWDNAAMRWVPADVPAGGSVALDDLTDVDTTGVADGDVLTFDSGASEWVPAAPSGGGGGGGLTLLSDQLLASAGTIDFTSISGSYKDLVIEARLRTNRAANISDALIVTVGTGGTLDTGATQYRSTTQRFNNGTSQLDRNDTGRANFVAAGSSIPGASADANVWAYFTMTIRAYAETTYWRLLRAESSGHLTSGQVYDEWSTGHWKNTAGAVDTVRLAGGTGSLIAGSRARLYGRP